MIDISLVLKELLKERKYFYNESDFQFYFAWYCKKIYPNINVRLEYEIQELEDNKRSYIDLILFNDKEAWIFEFKFKTKKSIYNDEENRETFEYKEHGARDLGVYSIHKDIYRIETMINKKKKIFDRTIVRGFSILLTNDYKYKVGFKNNSLFYNYGLNFENIKSGLTKFILPKGKLKEEMVVKNLKEIYHYDNYKINWENYSIYSMLIIEIE